MLLATLYSTGQVNQPTLSRQQAAAPTGHHGHLIYEDGRPTGRRHDAIGHEHHTRQLPRLVTWYGAPGNTKRGSRAITAK